MMIHERGGRQGNEDQAEGRRSDETEGRDSGGLVPHSDSRSIYKQLIAVLADLEPVCEREIS